ncbi:MAG: 2-hydroxyhepta-2,4-diene-1,7-dioate isomerase [Candidatus Methanoperedenaceae archaeon]|nr:MAG: 2-hydroxyhepta-2,4-diene-1,7-dioate isomerase [Candidatus Methanoperedenaceae archaeon]
MIGRFRYDNEVFRGEVRGERIVVERGLYCDTFVLSELELLPPTDPSKIICVGLNYVDHAVELDMPIPKKPLIFLKPPSAVIGHLGKIVYPDTAQRVDYEAELAVVIGKRCKNVPSENAGSVIMGYACFNDVTARDLQREDGQWTRSKSFDTFAPVGPFITEPGVDVRDISIKTRVNGKLRQDSRTSNLIFSLPELIEFISGIMTLEAGDIIATGTPPGVGELSVGDEIEIEIEDIGVLKNSVVRSQKT